MTPDTQSTSPLADTGMLLTFLKEERERRCKTLLAEAQAQLRDIETSCEAQKGRMLEDETRFSMSSLDVEFSPHRMMAKDPDLRVENLAADAGGEGSALGSGRLRAIAGHMASDESSLLLTGGAVRRGEELRALLAAARLHPGRERSLGPLLLHIEARS